MTERIKISPAAIIDQFWQRAVLSLTFCLLFASSPAVRADIVYSTDAKIGETLHLPIYSWLNDQQPTTGIILAIHGATLYSGTFDMLAHHLAATGYAVYAIDMRGFGRWQQESAKFYGDNGVHYTQSKEDILQTLRYLRENNPNIKIYCLGESLGANLAIWVASNRPDLIDGIILSSPCVKHIWHHGPREALDLTKGFFSPNKRTNLAPHIEPFLSSDKRVTEAYEADPIILTRLSPVELIKSMKTNKQALAQVQNIPATMPVLIIAGAKDKIYSAKAIPALAQQIGSDRKTVLIEPQEGHLLLENNFIAPAIIKAIDNWLAKNNAPSEHLTGMQSSLRSTGLFDISAQP